jgi:tetratricopeptide (TPR) repeat protein
MLEERLATLGDSHLEVAYAYHNLAHAWHELENWPATTDAYQRQVAIHERLNDVSEKHFVGLSNLASAYLGACQPDDAAPIVPRLRELGRKLPPDFSGWYSIFLLEGELARQKEHWQVAERLFSTAASYWLRLSTCHDPAFGRPFDFLALVYWDTNRMLAAERASRKAIRIWRDAGWNEKSEFVRLLVNLGRILWHRGAHVDARKQLREALAVAGRVRPAGHPQIARVEKLLGEWSGE